MANGKTDWDYIIVGAGSAGSALAARLSEDPAVQVLLLEAGGWDRSPFIHIPGFLPQAMGSNALNWKIPGAPDASLNNRALTWGAGRGMGGSSSINGMVYVRALPSDLRLWEEAGNPGWGYDGMLPYMKRMEHWRGDPDPSRGDSGPMNVRPFPEPAAVCVSVMNAFVHKGVQYVPDYNAGIETGIGITQASQLNGLRHSASVAYINPARDRANLTVRVNTRVLKLIIDKGVCRGVSVAEGKAVETLNCSREVILSAGSFGSPKILMLSGVGRADDLKGHGLPVLHDLPGVGANVNEHTNTFVTAKVNVRTYNSTRRNGLRKAAAGLRWLVDRDGPASTPANHLQAFIKTDPSERDADIQVQTMPMAFDPDPRAKTEGVMSVISLCRPEVRGRIALTSADPAAKPRFEIELLSRENDIRRLIAASRFVRDIYRSGPANQFGGVEMKPGADVQSDADWTAYFRAGNNHNYHPTSSCRMGPTPDDVVGHDLRVHGLQGLSVADASIMPVVTSGNTNATAVAIGEKAADLVRARYN